MKKSIGSAAFAIVICVAAQSARAGTTPVFSIVDFNAATTGQVTTNFNSVAPLDAGDSSCPGSGACFAGFNPLVVNSITFTASGSPVNVNSAGYYGAGDLANQYVVNSSANALTITLPSLVTAFGLVYGTLFNSSSATFTLSNLYTTTINPTLGNLQTQFVGFISTDPFDTITFSVPTGASWVVEDVVTASAALDQAPVPAALPLFASGLGMMGLLGWRRKRKSATASEAA